MDYVITKDNELRHYGVLGMKWGVRRYQKKDGTLTRLGKKHRDAAVKGLEESRSEALNRAAKMEQYTKTNRDSLKAAKVVYRDTRDPYDAWQVQALGAAYKSTGQAWVNSKIHADTYDAYVKAYSDGTIKIGEDYVVKNYRTGAVQLTESGRKKEVAIVDRVMADAQKRYAKQIKEYS